MDCLCIDLKCFYASVECVERGLDPFKTLLVVADESRGKGAICLAISPYMKSFGVKNRCRLFEIPNNLQYIIAKPRMKKYIEYSSLIYEIYLKYISCDDIHVYSIDEAFLDVTHYQTMYNKSPFKIGKMIINDIYKSTGIFATCGVGKNLYLAKIAMDITAKKVSDGIAFLDEESFKEQLWNHLPLTDFWHIGRGIEKRLDKLGIHTQKEIALSPTDILYKEFGVNAKYLIDHSWGKDETTISDIKAYVPKQKSISSGQILERDYNYNEAKLVLKEMVELCCLDLVQKKLVTNSISVGVGYADKNVKAFDYEHQTYDGGSKKIDVITNSYEILLKKVLNIYDEKIDKSKMIRKLSIGFGNLQNDSYEQYNLFTNVEKIHNEKKVQETIVELKNKYGKSTIIRGMNLDENATTLKRNKLTGGHNSE